MDVTDLDLSRAPIGDRAKMALINAVFENGDFIEHHYLEAKGPLDLTKSGTFAKIAKYILASANRMPALAQTALQGYGVMIIGVSKNSIEGMLPIEVMEVEKRLQKYLGAKGPQWDLTWIPIAGSLNKILFVTVDPPRDGMGPFICRANGDEMSDGRVYIRDKGSTREARADEVEALIERLRIGVKPDVDFEVQIIGDVQTVAIDNDQSIEAYLRDERERLIGAMPKPNKPMPINAYGLQDIIANLSQSVVSPTFETPEDRTEADYRSEIAQWEQETRDAWPGAVSNLARRHLVRPSFKIVNRTDTFFHDAELVVRASGGVAFADRLDRRVFSVHQLGLPYPPRIWGPRKTMPADYTFMFPPQKADDRTIPVNTPVVKRYGKGTSAIVVRGGEVRPRETKELENTEFVIAVPEGGAERVEVSWAITVSGFNAVYQGTIEIPIAGELDLTQFFMKISARTDR